MLKRTAIAIFLGISLNFSVGAAMVSFYVIETGVSDESYLFHSELWETAFMDVFFDAGHIVSNAPVLRLENRPSDVLQVVDMKEATQGGVEYMIIVMLEYDMEALTPNEILFYIYKVVKQEKIIERKVLPRKSKSTQDEYDNMKSIARGFVPYIGE